MESVESDGVTLHLGDCLKVMPTLQPADMVLTDPPHGTTACKWDSVIPLNEMWKAIPRRDNTPIVMTASQPFTTALIWSNMREFRYDLIWDKVNKYTGALNANRMPLRRHEGICVFTENCPRTTNN